MGAINYNGALPLVSIKPNQVTYYFEPISSGKREYDFSDNIKQPKNNNPKRGLSDKARKRIKSKIHWLLTYARPKRIFNDYTNKWFTFKINFITLTLPTLQAHRDTTIKRECFNQFLTELRKYHGLINYVWRSECQTNGNIHFHIATDSYIPWFIIRRIWNRQLRKLGYIDRYHNKFKDMTFQQYKEYMVNNGYKDLSKILAAYNYGKKTNWKDPNTTDIHSVNKIKNLAAYLSKYMAKKEATTDTTQEYDLKDRRIDGRNWGCSQSLSRCKSIIDYTSEFIEELTEYATDKLNAYVKSDVYFSSIFFNFSRLPKRFKNYVNKLFIRYKTELGYISGGIVNRNYSLKYF